MFGVELGFSSFVRRCVRTIGAALAVLLVAAFAAPASALVIELDDVAPDRIERQRAYVRGTLPSPVLPDHSAFAERLAEKGLVEGAPILIRIFKAESELELWMRKGDAFVLQATYPICHWTGTLGPKLREGDKQSPEGFYTIGRRQMRHVGRWRQAFNIGFPNLHDKRLERTGSYILVHGGCSSTGCYAMTENAQQIIHRLAAAAIRGQQDHFQVHIFPFRMTDAKMAAHAASPWADFWRDLKAGYDAFEETRLPPRVGVCRQRYVVAKATPGSRSDGALERVVAGSPGAAGFDTSRCDIPVVEPAEVIAGLSQPDGDPAQPDALYRPTSGHVVAQVERRESLAALPSSRVRLKRVDRVRKHAQSRRDLREKRRAYRESLDNSYRRTLLGAAQ